MAELSDVVKSIQSLEDTVKNPPKTAAQAEAAAEKARADAEQKAIFQGILDTLKGGFGAATMADKKQGGLIAGLLGGIGAGLGGIGKAVGSLGKGFGVGLAALGAGIAAFAIALGGASKILELIGSDGTALTTVITNFFDAFSEENALKMGGIIILAGLLAKLKVGPIAFGGNMAALGAGIAGFAGGILLGELVTGYGLKMMGGLDGSSLITVLSNFFNSMTPTVAAGLGTVVTLAGLLAKFDVHPASFAKQMVGMAAGIAGFVGGILIGEVAAGFALKLMGGLDGSALTAVLSNFFGAMTPTVAAGMGVVVTLAGILTTLKVEPTAFAKQMTGLGAGVAGFAGGILIGDAAATYTGLTGEGLKTLLANFFGAMTPEVAAGLGTVVTLAGVLTKFKVEPVAFASQMMGLGAGVAGFAGGIILGDAAATYAGVDGSQLATLLQNFFGAMTPEIAAGLLTVVTLAGIATKLGITDIKGATGIALGMTGIGAGVAGFSAGIILGEGAAKLGALAGLDGSSLAKLMKNFFGAFDGIGIVALGAIITAGAALGFTAAGVPAVIAGMTAIGAGIAAFMGALVVADWIASLGGDNVGGSLATLLANIGKAIGGFIGGIGAGAIKQLEGFDADKLSKLGQGIKDIGVGMLAFAGGQVAGVAGGVVESIGSFFGADSPLDKIAELSKDTDINVARLSELGLGIKALSEGMSSFAAVDSQLMAKNALSLAAVLEASSPKDEGFFSSTKNLLGSLVESVKGAPDAATGGLMTTNSAGIYQLHQGEMVLDNAAVAAFSKSLDMVNMSQGNEMNRAGVVAPVIVNNNSVDNSVKTSQTTSVAMPEPTRTNESTLAALSERMF